MKLLSIVGSPRIRGNSHVLAQKFCEGAMMAGAEVEEVLLAKLKIAPCIDCDKCNEDGICKTKDDFASVVEKMRAVDGIVFSTPVYCCSVSGHMKLLFDRCNSITYPDWNTGLEGKYAAFIIGAGYPAPERGPFELHHKLRLPTLLRMNQAVKMADPSVGVRGAINMMTMFDPTIDTLRIMYQFCVFQCIEVVGALEVTALGHGKKTIQERPEDLQRAVQFGAQFGGLVTFASQNIPLTFNGGLANMKPALDGELEAPKPVRV